MFKTPFVLAMKMKNKLPLFLLTLCLAFSASAFETLPLAGTWRFAIDRNDTGLGEKWFTKNLADKIKLPLLIMHGEDDANPGTTPLQGVKLYEAIRGNGGTARLVMLPHEPHAYTALESNEQYVAEMIRWFDKYVKNAAPRATK